MRKVLFLLALLLPLSLHAPPKPMKVMVQWTQKTPRDWVQANYLGWKGLPRRSVPRTGELGGLDETPGWIFNLSVQGVEFGGADHYAVEGLLNGGVRVTVWYDDPDDFEEGMFWAQVWTILPLAPDSALNGAINTRQSKIIYAQERKLSTLNRNVENTLFISWSEFRPPPEDVTYHGVWIGDGLIESHDDAAPTHGWREWGDHLPDSELDENGRVKAQRPQGRTSPSSGTITYFIRNTALVTGLHTADIETEMITSSLDSPVNRRCNVDASTTDECYTWTTLATNPNVADWPNGQYKFSIDVSSIMLLSNGYGFLTLNGVAGHMANVDSGLTTHNETWTQTEAAFTGTGIKTATRTLDPASGAAGDRFEGMLVGDNSGDAMAGRMDLSQDDLDSFGEGPWAAGADDDIMVIQGGD